MLFSTNRLVILLFFILLVGAFIFHLERMLFADASFILFRIINMDSLQIQEHRYGSFITQAFPLLGARLHLPLQGIVLLYSISFNLFYLVVALLLVFPFRQTALAILMSFYYLLFVSDTFFWTNNEVHQGIAWMFLFFGVMLHMGSVKKRFRLLLPVLLFLAFLGLYSHMLVAFPFAFLWLFFMSRDNWPLNRRWTLIFSALLLIIGLSKFLLSTGSGSHYDVDKMHAVTHISFKRIAEALTSPMAKEMVQRSVWNYWLVPLLFFAGIFITWRLKQYRVLALTLVFSVAFGLALCLTFPTFLAFYSESEWMPGSIIFTAPFVYYFLPRLSEKKAVLLLAGIYLVRLAYIGQASQKWTDRKNWIMARLDQMEQDQISKGIVYEEPAVNRTLIMNWGVPTESIIASAIKKQQPHKTFVVGTPESLSGKIPEHRWQMMAPFETLSSGFLNHRYFNFDTTAHYTVLPAHP